MSIYNVKILEVIHDSQEGFITMNLDFESHGRRLMNLKKQDFMNLIENLTNMAFNREPNDKEVNDFAKLLKGREFKLDHRDDPNRQPVTPENYEQFAKEFRDRITTELESTKEGLEDDTKQIQRKLGRMKASGKLDASSLLREEQMVKSKLGDV